MNAKQSDQKKYHDSHSQLRQFSSGQLVMAKDFRAQNKWIPGGPGGPGVIVDSSGPVSYNVELQDGKVIKRYVDHLRDRSISSKHSSLLRFLPEDEATQEFEFFNDQSSVSPSPTTTNDNHANVSVPRYPCRERRPPKVS